MRITDHVRATNVAMHQSTHDTMSWSIEIEEDGAVNLRGRLGELDIELLAEITRSPECITLKNAHFTKNSPTKQFLSRDQLASYGRDFLIQHGNGASQLLVLGWKRTTGAFPGKVPKPFRINLV